MQDTLTLSGQREAGGDGDRGGRLAVLPVLDQCARDRLTQCRCKLLVAVEVGDQFAGGVVDELERSARRGSDGRRATGQALQEDQAEGFELSWEDTDISDVVKLSQARLPVGTDEIRIGQVELDRQVLLQLLLRHGAGTCDDSCDAQSRIRRRFFVNDRGTQQAIDALDVGELADKK